MLIQWVGGSKKVKICRRNVGLVPQVESYLTSQRHRAQTAQTYITTYLGLDKAVTLAKKRLFIFQYFLQFIIHKKFDFNGFSKGLVKVVQKICFNFHFEAMEMFKHQTLFTFWTKYTMRTNLLNWCNLVSISKNVVFYALLVVRIYQYLADFVNIY